MPNVFKGGIILGAAIAAFLRVTKDGDAANVFQSAPIAGTLGVIICLVFAFSKPLQAIAINKKMVSVYSRVWFTTWICYRGEYWIFYW